MISHYPHLSQNSRSHLSSLAGPEKISRFDITAHVDFKKDRSRLIGEGSSSQVYSGWYTPRGHNKPIAVAIKSLLCIPQTKAKIEKRLSREIVSWERVSQHQNVVEFFGVYQAPGDAPHLVSRFLSNNKFLKYISQDPELQLTKAKDIARGLEHLHSNGVIHGDLKADNIFISDDGIAQITDFGISVIPEIEGFTTNITRKIRYSAPELMPLTELDDSTKPTKKSDIFSLGILLLQIIHGTENSEPYNHIPFNNLDPYESRLLRLIHCGERPKREFYNSIHDNRWVLIEMCWAAMPEFRPHMNQVRELLV